MSHNSIDRERQDEIWLGDRLGLTQQDSLHAALDALYADGPPAELTAAAGRNAWRVLPRTHTPTVWYDGAWIAPVGPVFLAATARGLAAVEFGVAQDAFLDHMRRKLGSAPTHNPARLAGAFRQLREYLSQARVAFDLPIDTCLMTDFQRTVLEAALAIPRGKIATYGEIARRIGRPRAARAVGQALGRNPIPIVIPCHRVLAADGSLGGYSGGGGVATKRTLLQLEGALQ